MRTVYSGFDFWFNRGATSLQRSAAWKECMLVFLGLYPTVFLYTVFVNKPFLQNRMPLWLTMFIGKTVSVLLLGYVLTPFIMKKFRWWLSSSPESYKKVSLLGAQVVVLLNLLIMFAFSRFEV